MVYFFTYVYFIGIFMIFSQIEDVSSLKFRTHSMVNAIQAPEGQFPFMVSVRMKSNHIGTGTIIAQNWILTAAHCTFRRQKRAKVTVLYGRINFRNGRRKDGYEMEVAKIIEHEHYSRKTFYQNDISVLLLKGSLQWSYVVLPIRLIGHEQFYRPATLANLVGWGHQAEKSSGTTYYVHYSQLEIFPDEICNAINKGFFNPYVEMCAGIRSYQKSVCDGDSGGPLIVNGYQIGISSWVQTGLPCSAADNPTVLTKIAPYIDWIYHKTGISFHNG